ncbi:DUF2786 domain-containing protein [Clostridium sp. AWRP]|uniref:DUF2786 domain-containing protein n=1 Tax=Clostridium sp. AWRP TaxID=2212991 RepID=UPI000FDB9448|nr:DUF2786 domain-containing protein [Clostridium sp. AWRP]AZV56779.1 DUF2786 domain-containing protein [Clostridium sp. AWRP]
MDTKIIEKVKKLLALSESSNENEAQLAMIKAQEILAKYKLSLKEVKEFKKINSKIIKKVSDITFRTSKWKAELADVIANNFGCYIYFETKRTHKIVFLGKEEDAMVCNIILEYAIDSIESTMRVIKYSYRKNRMSTRGITNDYAMGFIEGLNYRFEKQKQNNREWGLVLMRDADVTETYNNMDFRKNLNCDVDFEYSEIYDQGVEDGKKFSISDKVEQGKSDETVLLEC